jgi:hypothetical protein
MNTEELNVLMKDSAEDAINYLKENHNQLVTISKKDLPQIDVVLTKLAVLYIQHPMKSKELFTISSIMGAFVGELFKRTAGGEWFMDTSNPDAPFVVLNYGGKSFPFASICYEKMVNQPEISINKYYELAIGGSTQ